MIKMIFQIDFWGSLIGSALATGFSIGAWVSIKIIEKYLKKRKEKQNFNKVYHLLSKKSLYPFMASEISGLINEIGETNILKVLKFSIEYFNGGFFLNNERYQLIVAYKLGINSLKIREGANIYDYEILGTNIPIKESFLKFFEQQCKIEKIKLKN